MSFVDGMIHPPTVFKFYIQTLSCHARCFSTSWRVPKDLPYFEGHFPNRPILPAVAIVDGSLEFLRRALAVQDLPLKGVSNAKFIAPLEPEMEVQIAAHHNGESSWDIEWKSVLGGEDPRSLVNLTLLL
jgi:3-hydroxymyristoyl/3-hydroxydecanoyl-(acyl carrier protein) dehydratase